MTIENHPKYNDEFMSEHVANRVMMIRDFIVGRLIDTESDDESDTKKIHRTDFEDSVRRYSDGLQKWELPFVDVSGNEITLMDILESEVETGKLWDEDFEDGEAAYFRFDIQEESQLINAIASLLKTAKERGFIDYFDVELAIPYPASEQVYEDFYDYKESVKQDWS